VGGVVGRLPVAEEDDVGMVEVEVHNRIIAAG
jgi:hypothetical protein